jgi:ABC-type transport system involved in cytochrome c biogenesis ATPase subunit
MREFIVKASSLLVLLIFFVSQTHAGDIRWEGNYRAEGLRMINPTLADGGNNKAYMLHHLTLKPQITAFDGLTIHSRFDIFNNSRYPNDQLGQVFGAGVNQSPGTQKLAHE